MKKYDLLVAGEINPDLILSGPDVLPQFGQIEKVVEAYTLTMGSSSVIFASGAARLGLKVAFLGVVGDDLFGHYMLGEMQQIGIDITHVIIDPTIRTGLSLILNTGEDRAILTYIGAVSALTGAHFSEGLIEQCSHLHVASFFIQKHLRRDLARIFKKARSLGLSTSLDTNWDPEENWDGVEEVLMDTTIFFPNRAEAEAITCERDIQKSLLLLSRRANFVALKNGAQGGFAQSGEMKVKINAPKVKVVDTVGAGDSFDAGFIYGFLQGWSLDRCLRLAVACGSLSTQSSGGTNGQSSLEQALEVARQLHE